MTVREKLATYDGPMQLALIRIVDKLEEIITTEKKHLHSIGVAWPSAHTERFRFAEGLLKDINRSLPGDKDATEERLIEKDGQQQHQDGDGSGQAAEAGSSDSPLQSGQIEPVQKEKKKWW